MTSKACSTKCHAELDQYIEVATTSLEACGPIVPQVACKEFGDVTQICNDDTKCARAKAAFSKYCSQK